MTKQSKITVQEMLKFVDDAMWGIIDAEVSSETEYHTNQSRVNYLSHQVRIADAIKQAIEESI